ncbi:hypothetical protein GGX14DRAFT_407653 [Mycena pura]|uniref:Uncharacterized protein n=1 Tax=Mycena pura TaxID=153505 RepID=A0AAD6Y206_9AGAR|nr:hypothetical protein GGX14DRAFT_407653 [Mycena pura]
MTLFGSSTFLVLFRHPPLPVFASIPPKQSVDLALKPLKAAKCYARLKYESPLACCPVQWSQYRVLTSQDFGFKTFKQEYASAAVTVTVTAAVTRIAVPRARRGRARKPVHKATTALPPVVDADTGFRPAPGAISRFSTLSSWTGTADFVAALPAHRVGSLFTLPSAARGGNGDVGASGSGGGGTRGGAKFLYRMPGTTGAEYIGDLAMKVSKLDPEAAAVLRKRDRHRTVYGYGRTFTVPIRCQPYRTAGPTVDYGYALSKKYDKRSAGAPTHLPGVSAFSGGYPLTTLIKR